MFEKGVSAESVIAARELKPIQDLNALERVLDEVIAENPDPVARIKEGSTKPMDYLIGQVMKKTQGKANPGKLRELLQKKL